MKKKKPEKNSPDTSGTKHPGSSLSQIIRAYLSIIRLLHHNLGAPRIIAAYLFLIFAVLSLLFTIRIPVISLSQSPSDWAKTQSRAITIFIMIVNFLVYGIILNWRKGNIVHTVTRIALIGMAIYFDTLLVKVVYILIRDGSFF